MMDRGGSAHRLRLESVAVPPVGASSAIAVLLRPLEDEHRPVSRAVFART